MKQLKKTLSILAMIGLPAIFVVSCKQEENTENNPLRNNSSQSSAFAHQQGVEQGATNLLLDFWSNYASHKGVATYLSDISPNLNASLPAMDAVYTAHYALNTGMVYPDSVYENVIEDSTDINLPVTEELTVTKKQICVFVDEAVNRVKTSFNSIEASGDNGKSLNRLELEPIIMGGTNWIIRIRWRVSRGKLYSVGNMNEYPNIATTYFTSSIPWLSQESYGGTATTYLNKNEKYYVKLLYGLRTFTDQDFINSWALLSNGKAAHHKLSNRNVFWPDPLAQLSGWTYAYNYTHKAVKTPNGVYGGRWIGEVNVDQESGSSPLKQIVATDVYDCNNPLKPGLGVTPTALNMTPSKLLGWFGSEASFSLLSIRVVPPVAMNYFWNKKRDLVILGQQRAASSTVPNMNVYKSGYYALTDLKIHHNPALIGSCTFSNCGDLCLHAADYRTWLTFAHYTTQPKTPQELAIYF